MLTENPKELNTETEATLHFKAYARRSWFSENLTPALSCGHGQEIGSNP
jgi:hypothetical protein